MLIDWFTVSAQTLNFLVLVWLMKRFLYKPILHAIDEREERIARELAAADLDKKEAQTKREEYQHKIEDLDQQRDALLREATDQAEAERQRLLDEARAAADALNSKRMESLRNEAHSLSRAITNRAQREVFAIARKTLADLATTSLEEQVGEVLMNRLRNMDGDAREEFAKALDTATEPVLVRSAFDLPADQRVAIQKALNEAFSADVRVRFEKAPDLISGIELTTNGQKVAWSIADYLTSMEKGVGELLEGRNDSKAKTEPSGMSPESQPKSH